MKKIFLILMLLVLTGCGDVKEKPKEIPEFNVSDLELFVGESKEAVTIIKGDLKDLFTEVDGDCVKTEEGNKIKGLKEGEATVRVRMGSVEKEFKVTVKEKPKESPEFAVSDLELFVGESKEAVTIIKGDLKDLFTEVDGDCVKTEEGNKIKGLKEGEATVRVRMGSVEKEFKVTVKERRIKMKEEKITIDVFETFSLSIDCPDDVRDCLEYKIFKQGIIKIENGIVYPLNVGKTRVRISATGDDSVKKCSFDVEVTVDPIEIIKSVHNDEAIMKKTIYLYGENPKKVPQELLGSVSRYMFADLNLKEQIIPLYENKYTGMTATPEIVAELDRKKHLHEEGYPGYPRSGVLMTETAHITYHDTGNNNYGADAAGHVKWMVNPASVNGTCRSWHYTVDDKEVIHTIPDNEITWQGDEYEAYTTSIGIETCVNQGANMNKVWHRMGKLCAMLLGKHNLKTEDIYQHNDWNGKECPQTLRRNKLYPYAISLIEAEVKMRRYLKAYKIEFESLNPEYLDNTGQIIKAPDEEITVGYKVTITKGKEYNESVTLYTKVKPLE